MIPLISRRLPRLAPQDFQIVNREEFFKLLLGFSHLERFDDPANGRRGLRDTETGKVYMIDGAQLAKGTSARVVVNAS